HARELVEVCLDLANEHLGVPSRLLEQREGNASFLFEHRQDEVLGDDLRVAATTREIGSGADRLLALGRHPIGTHAISPFSAAASASGNEGITALAATMGQASPKRTL